MSTVPGKKDEAAPNSDNILKKCWSCRILSGSGLLAAGGYVFNAARNVMLLGAPTSMGTVAQITFALSLGAMGIVLLVDPVGKAYRIEPEDSEKNTQKRT